MAKKWAGVCLADERKASAFREAFYADVYDHAWELTKAADKADELTKQVFTEAEGRFRDRPLPPDPMMYLRSQAVWLYEKLSEEEVGDVSMTPGVLPVDPALRAETVYDGEKTSMWLAGEGFDMAELEAAREASAARPKETGNTRSVKLSIFNTALFILVMAAAAFLLYELGVMYKLI